MLTPTHVQLKYFSYPVGNTPAVNLLRDLPAPESGETANILSVACGDPRSILFSLWCDKATIDDRKISFMCCDIDPAVLARNVVLLTLAQEGQCESEDRWSLFYHFFVTHTTLRALRLHIAKLLEASESIESWSSSKYGLFIRWTNKATLHSLRRYWNLYIQDDSSRASKARKAILKRSKEIGDMRITTGARSAGPRWMESLDVTAYNYRKFWETGVAGGNDEDVRSLRQAGGGVVNPMFAVSSAPSNDFAVHYGTEPLMGFPAVEAFEIHCSGMKKDVAYGAKCVVDVAKAKFKDWCENMKIYACKERCTITLFCGDALAFGRALQIRLKDPSQGTTVYIKPWSGTALMLDGFYGSESERSAAFGPFDVIDSSNLGDHVGLINMLSATTPLLQPGPFSVLYTESLLMASEEISKALSVVLCSDVTTFSLLTGIAPTGLVTSVTMDGVGNEAAMFAICQPEGRLRQYRIRVMWKYSEYSDATTARNLEESNQPLPVKIDPNDLSAYLFNVYKAMFDHENVSNIMSRLQRVKMGHHAIGMPRYTRATIGALIRLIMARTITKWDEAMHSFTRHVESDRSLMIGTNSLQELYLHLHLCGVWTSDVLRAGPRQISNIPGLNLRPTAQESGVLARLDAPPIVHIVLVVPRRNLEVFTKQKLDEIGTPQFHVAVSQNERSNYENNFSSFHCFFGSVKQVAMNEAASIIEEDDQGWSGSKDLVVVCPVPTFSLLIGPRKGIHVALRISTSPETAMKYSFLGPQHMIFEAGLQDEQRCFVCLKAPTLGELRPEPIAAIEPEGDLSTLINRTTDPKRDLPTLIKTDNSHRATQLQQQLTFAQDPENARHLSEGVEVTIVQDSPAILSAKVGAHSTFLLRFPFPVQGSRLKTRIARKSSWIEITVPIATVLEVDRFDSWTQMVTFSGRSPICSTIPRVNLAIMPQIRSAKGQDSSWVQNFLGSTLSDREEALNQPGSPSSGNVKIDLKQSLANIFIKYAGGDYEKNNRQIHTFQLSVEKSCHTILFATGLYHDLDLGSLVMEAYVLPLTIHRVMALQNALRDLVRTRACGIIVSKEETILWKRMLPALAERCRTWSHKRSCAYTKKGAPLTTEEGENPLCSCGENKISGADLANMGCKEWAPFAKYVVRIAISPIFPIPYVESSMSRFRKGADAAFRGGGIANTTSSTFDAPWASETRSSVSMSASSGGCSGCGGSEARLKACAGCGKAKYCGTECQKAAWKEHKKECKK